MNGSPSNNLTAGIGVSPITSYKDVLKVLTCHKILHQSVRKRVNCMKPILLLPRLFLLFLNFAKGSSKDKTAKILAKNYF